MLQRPASGDEVCGVWSRSQLLEMDERFCEAMELAFASGAESRAAAATFQVAKSRPLGVVLEQAWHWFVDAKFDVPAAEVLSRVRAGYPGVTTEQVREDFRRRLQQKFCLGGQ